MPQPSRAKRPWPGAARGRTRSAHAGGTWPNRCTHASIQLSTHPPAHRSIHPSIHHTDSTSASTSVRDPKQKILCIRFIFARSRSGSSNSSSSSNNRLRTLRCVAVDVQLVEVTDGAIMNAEHPPPTPECLPCTSRWCRPSSPRRPAAASQPQEQQQQHQAECGHCCVLLAAAKLAPRPPSSRPGAATARPSRCWRRPRRTSTLPPPHSCPAARPLLSAAGDGHCDVVEVLMCVKADVDKADPNGATPWIDEGGSRRPLARSRGAVAHHQSGHGPGGKRPERRGRCPPV